ncbi:MAG: PrsW family intrarane metalloprotease [Acidimicrobiales bacterium]|nr:PrsW family intrarane metalloprotease [Acidimicrobiales bacterium]
MTCPRCAAPVPEAARFCPACGGDPWASSDDGRRRSFAVHPGEPVLSFNLTSSLLPLASGSAPQTYRFALAAGLAVPVVLAAFGLLAAAFAAAAVVVPTVYVVYLQDVNQWEDEPAPVLGATIALALVLGAGFTYLWREVLLPAGLLSPTRAGISGRDLLVIGLLAPIGAELLRQLGPIWLASKPKFDDIIDGLTFGVASGAAFAAAETLVLNRWLFTGGLGRIAHPDAGLWVALVVTAALVKPIVYGAATGIAVAGWSGVGAGHDGFGPGYLRALLEALAYDVAFALGLYLTGRVGGTFGVVLGLGWGLLVAAVAVVRLRMLLHVALLEAALEASVAGTRLGTAASGVAHCPTCELPLADGAHFCMACGTAVRAAPKQDRRRNAAADDAASPATPVSAPAGQEG